MTRPRPNRTITTREFWMVRSHGNYCLYRKSRRPRYEKVTSSYNKDFSWMKWTGDPTQMLCVPQVHRLFPGLGRMKTGDTPKLVRLTLETA